MRLEGKIAIVVGAGQTKGETIGNGRATAIRFSQEGAKVLVVDRDEDSAHETIDLIKAEGGSGSFLRADITQEQDCDEIIRVCLQRYSSVDILHNNVGRSEGDGLTQDVTSDIWDTLMSTNLKGMFFTIKKVLPIMKANNSGVIINISSTSSISVSETITYKTSKGAINTMTQHLAIENAPFGVRVNGTM